MAASQLAASPQLYSLMKLWKCFNTFKTNIYPQTANEMTSESQQVACWTSLCLYSSYFFGPLSWTQWAAVSSQRLLSTDAPHTWPVPRIWRLTCQGHSPSRDTWPPTIRELRYGLVPHSENTHTQEYTLTSHTVHHFLQLCVKLNPVRRFDRQQTAVCIFIIGVFAVGVWRYVSIWWHLLVYGNNTPYSFSTHKRFFNDKSCVNNS